MNKTIRLLEELIQLTRQLSVRLDSALSDDEPSLEPIHKMMEQRGRCVQNLHDSQQTRDRFLSSPHQKRLKKLFDTFEELDKEFRNSLQKSLHQQQSKLELAGRNREAVKSYQKSSETPDISFY